MKPVLIHKYYHQTAHISIFCDVTKMDAPFTCQVEKDGNTVVAESPNFTTIAGINQYAQQELQHNPVWHTYESDVDIVVDFARKFNYNSFKGNAINSRVDGAIKRIEEAHRKKLQGYSLLDVSE